MTDTILAPDPQPVTHRATGASAEVGIVRRRAGRQPWTGRDLSRAERQAAAYASGDPDVIAAQAKRDLARIKRAAGRDILCNGWRETGAVEPRTTLRVCPECGHVKPVDYNSVVMHLRPPTAIERATHIAGATHDLASVYPIFAQAIADGKATQ